MATITIKINERTKAGKTLMALLELFSSENKGVEIVKTPNAETLKAMHDAQNNINLIEGKDTKDLFNKLRY